MAESCHGLGYNVVNLEVSHTGMPSGSRRVQEPFPGGRRIMSAARQEQLDDRDKKGPCSTFYIFTEVNLECCGLKCPLLELVMALQRNRKQFLVSG